MKYQRMILFTVLFILGALLSACGTDAAPSNEVAEDSLGNLVAVENPGVLATTAISDEFWVCLYTDADYEGESLCYEDAGFNGETSGTFDDPRFSEEFFNDIFSSVELRPGLTVELFKDANYQGEALTLTADSNYIGDEFNDEISSIRVTVP